MKKLFCLICVFSMLVSLGACKKANTPKETTPTDNTSLTHPTSPTVPTPSEPTSFAPLVYDNKENVEEFIELMLAAPEKQNVARYIQEDRCFNITTTAVAAETDMEIFQFRNSLGAYALLDNSLFQIGGHIVSVIPCDFDADGNKDLLIAHSTGSGNVYHRISLFNSVTKDFTDLHKVNNFAYLRDFFVVPSAADIYFTGKTEADGKLSYPVLVADNILEDGIIVKHMVTGIAGHIEVIDGKPQFVPYQK